VVWWNCDLPTRTTSRSGLPVTVKKQTKRFFGYTRVTVRGPVSRVGIIHFIRKKRAALNENFN
jgi:hypothetical protein